MLLFKKKTYKSETMSSLPKQIINQVVFTSTNSYKVFK